jgi:hypothetical protein
MSPNPSKATDLELRSANMLWRKDVTRESLVAVKDKVDWRLHAFHLGCQAQTGKAEERQLALVRMLPCQITVHVSN